MTDDEIIDAIRDVRARNNINWMGILKIALQHAPGETKTLLLAINEEDRAVSDFVKLLCFPSMKVPQ